MVRKTAVKAKNGLITAFNSSLFQILVWGVSALVLSASIYHLSYAKKVIPGVHVAGIDIGRLTYAQAVKKLEKAEKDTYKTLSLTYGNQIFEVSTESISLAYDWQASVKRAYEVGRTGNVYIDIKDKFAGLVKPLKLPGFYSLNEDSLNSIFAKISGEINKDPSNASFVLTDGWLEISPSVDGKSLDRDYLYDQVMLSLGFLAFDSKEIVVEDASAEISEEDLSSIYDEASALVSSPFSITYEEDEWVLSQEQLLEFLLIERDGGVLTLGLDKTKFEGYIDILAQNINQLPRGKVTALEEDRVVGFELIQDGKELDVKQFTEDFKKAFFGGERTMQASVIVVSGPSDPSKYGILSLLGEGSSSYAGSANARAHNLTLAAQRTGGVLVPPGGVYSFNNSVGEISGKTGYDSAYIISNGRTILGEGGGVCQTSTTLFRAVLNAGLPIVTRYPHAYRVYYYELDSPVGFDASIYQPSLDFQFKNDTPNFILVESSWNAQARRLNFRLYGTPDGREVEISEPQVTDIIPPPEALYQDDPTLPKGETKQVDFAAWGATVEFTRKVTKNGELIIQDTFNSTYRPWRAIYLVGTKKT